VETEVGWHWGSTGSTLGRDTRTSLLRVRLGAELGDTRTVHWGHLEEVEAQLETLGQRRSLLGPRTRVVLGSTRGRWRHYSVLHSEHAGIFLGAKLGLLLGSIGGVTLGDGLGQRRNRAGVLGAGLGRRWEERLGAVLGAAHSLGDELGTSLGAFSPSSVGRDSGWSWDCCWEPLGDELGDALGLLGKR
jgi:hypothetical protein